MSACGRRNSSSRARKHLWYPWYGLLDTTYCFFHAASGRLRGYVWEVVAEDLELCVLSTELQEKKKRSGEEGGEGGKGGKGKGKEEDDAEDALDWWSRYYETLKDRERSGRKEGQAMSRTSKKKEKTPEETEEEKLKKKIPRLTVRTSKSSEEPYPFKSQE